MATPQEDKQMDEKKQKVETKSAFYTYQPCLVQIVEAMELIASSKLKRLLGDDVVNDIRSCKASEEEKVQIIFNQIWQSDFPDKLNVLAEALKGCDLTYVPDIILKHYDVNTECQLTKVVTGMKDADFDLKLLAHFLQSKDLLKEIDVQDIDTEYLNRENKTAGLIVMVDRIACHQPVSWYQTFLDSLFDCDMDYIANKIDPNFGNQSLEYDYDMMDDVTSDVYWRNLIMDLFRSQIIKHVNPKSLLPNMAAVFELADKNIIRNLSTSHSHQKGMEELLVMLDKKECPGKWQTFTQALVEAGFGWVKDFIEGKYLSKESDSWEAMVNLFELQFSERIKPMEILPHLRQQTIISETDCQEIEQKCRLFGDSEAVFLLLSYLPRQKRRSWYPAFMKILIDTGYDEFVSDVDSDIYKELIQKQDKSACKTVDHRMSIDEDGDIKENYLSATETPAPSNDNLSSPQEQNETRDDLGKNTDLVNFNVNDDDGGDEITRQKLLANTKLEQPYNKLSASLSDTQSLSSSDHQGSESHKAYDKLPEISVFSETEEKTQNIVSSPYDGVKDDQDSDTDNENIVTEVLKLRNYQMELAEHALKGKNCIIVAPTGSGKTYVALKIIKDHMEKMKTRFPKVVFLVGQSALANQQAVQCKTYLSEYRVKLVTGEIQRDAKLARTLSSWLNRRDILVVTAQILVNAIIEKDIKIQDFTLIVFDECHHAHAKHAYTQIMDEYMDLKLDESVDKQTLPMIVGLTASVGVGRANTREGAEEHIQKMIANLDAEELSTVVKYLPELSEHVIIPEQVIEPTRSRKSNVFGEKLGKMMTIIERGMIKSSYASFLPQDGSILKGPSNKGSDPYTQWISQLWRETAKINDQDARRFFETCRLYLDLYNKVLIIYEDARVKDAMQFLEEKLLQINEGIREDKTDTEMRKIYENARPALTSCIHDKDHINPKLEKLKDIIFQLYKDKPDSRVIVFIKTRDLVQAIERWMKETAGLSCLNPKKFVGTQASGEKGGMTKNDQDDILAMFRSGGNKIIIATSVAEEGLDIQTCNLVIRYDHVTNEIAMVQARGRGRAEGSKFVVLASEKRKTAEKEEVNLIREARMNEAIKKVQERIKNYKPRFMAAVQRIQIAEKGKRDLEKLQKKKRTRNSEFILRCGKCGDYICNSSDIKKIQNAHHAVINEEVREHITTPRSTAKRIDSLTTCGVGKVKCKNCGKELGNVTIHKEAEFPILKIEHFIVADSAAKTNVYKRWKSVPFCPEELTDDDLQTRLQGEPYVQE